jgi:hypothetical protein
MTIYKFWMIVLAILSVVFYACESKSPTDDNVEDTLQWETVFFDDFNRNNGPVGSNYLVQLYSPSEGGSDTLSISNNMLQLSGELFYAIRYANEVTNDVIRVSAKFTTTDAPSGSYGFGVAVRNRNLGTDWEVQEAYGGSAGRESGIEIFKMSGSDPQPLIGKAYDVQENRSYLLELTVDENDLTLLVKDLTTNMTETLSVKDTGTLLTGGIVSIIGSQGEEDVIYFDDFKIEKYE